MRSLYFWSNIKYWSGQCPELSRKITLEDFQVVTWQKFLKELAFT